MNTINYSVGALALLAAGGLAIADTGGAGVGKPDQVIVIEGRRAPSEAAVSAKSMRYLPFVVPEGVTRITVTKEFDHGPGRRTNTVDLGLFDPRGHGPGGPGFRGWQGGTSHDLVLSGVMDEGRHYIAGPIPAGTWHLAQWYLQSNDYGLGYKYTVTLSFDGPKPPERTPDVPKYDPGVLDPKPGWYPGNLHAHTIHSDGQKTVEALAAMHRALGHRFLAVTDHNTPRQHWELAKAGKAVPDMLLIYGTEITSPGGHANVLNMKPGHWFDFRLDPGDGRLPKVIAEAHAQGALFSANHPFAFCTTCTWRYPEAECETADAVEVWNGAWGADDAKTVALWDSILKMGRKVPAFGGSDFHKDGDSTSPTVWVHAQNLSTPAVMDALRRGRITLSETPKGPRLFLTADNGKAIPGDTVDSMGRLMQVEAKAEGGKGCTLRLVWATGETSMPVTSDDAILGHALPPDARYVRAELLKPGEDICALTNAIYLRP